MGRFENNLLDQHESFLREPEDTADVKNHDRPTKTQCQQMCRDVVGDIFRYVSHGHGQNIDSLIDMLEDAADNLKHLADQEGLGSDVLRETHQPSYQPIIKQFIADNLSLVSGGEN